MQSKAKASMRLALAVLLCCATLAGCKPIATPASDDQPVPIELELATPTPTPTPPAAPHAPATDATAEPDMTFDESGNIWFSARMKAQFSARTFSFDHAPRILIYHTHAAEAFREAQPEKEGATPQPAATPARTPKHAAPAATEALVTPAPANAAATRSDDPEKTVVHLGDLLSDALTARGFVVFHDRTNVEQPALASAYERSRTVMAKYSDIDVYIDLHRNAADPVKGQNDVVLLDGQRTARMFFVVGTGITAGDAKNALPNWQENYALAYALYTRLAAVNPRLVKENRVKQGVYNQDMGLCLLAEIGHNANLLADAENTVPLFADALQAVCVW